MPNFIDSLMYVPNPDILLVPPSLARAARRILESTAARVFEQAFLSENEWYLPGAMVTSTEKRAEDLSDETVSCSSGEE